MSQLSQCLELFTQPANEDWAFSGQSSKNRFTHTYHRYPAKFVPNLVNKLIEEYTLPDDTIADVFAGCGTTLVESKIHGRPSIGVDVNPVARMITEAKINPLDPRQLAGHVEIFLRRLTNFTPDRVYYARKHPRIDYWFREEEKNKIAFLYARARRVRHPGRRAFYLCAISNILKPCSRWLQSGTKPQLDPSRTDNIADPFSRIAFQLRQMMKQNQQYFDSLVLSGLMETSCEIRDADARATGIASGTVAAVITSPPYVTSYEYADIHQLTGYWFEYFDDLRSFRKKFIGTFYSEAIQVEPTSSIAKQIVGALKKRSSKYAREVAKYFQDMSDVSKEIKRILRPNGVACIVIGNTALKGVDIRSAQAFAEMLQQDGFEITDVIKRQVTNKINPTIRDKTSGRFTTLESTTSKEVYPEEYIVIAKKSSEHTSS